MKPASTIGLIAALAILALANSSCTSTSKSARTNPSDSLVQQITDVTKLRRAVTIRVDGNQAIFQSTTESDDPATAAQLIEYAKRLQSKIAARQTVQTWDASDQSLVAVANKIVTDVAPTESGIQITQGTRDPQATALLAASESSLNEYLRTGKLPEPGRVSVDAPVPPSEAAIGGVKHRILLAQPAAAQVKVLKAQGVSRIISFRKLAEHPTYDESAAAQNAGIDYLNLPYREPAELTDDLFDQARAQLRAADSSGNLLILHCHSGNRVAPVWAAYRILDNHIPMPQALAEAKMLHMTNPKYEEVLRDYVKRKMAEK